MKLNKKKRAMSSLYYINQKKNQSKKIRESTESMGVIKMEDDLDTEIKDQFVDDFVVCNIDIAKNSHRIQNIHLNTNSARP